MQSQPTEDPIRETENLTESCVAIIDEILEQLREQESYGSEEFVHQTRVLTKRLRAAWNQVRHMVPDAKIKQRRRALREISARFSGSRDQAVLKTLCSKLADEKSDNDQERVLLSVGDGIELPEDQHLITAEQLASLLEQEKQEWLALDWKDGAECNEVIIKNTEKSYRKARKATRIARKTICSETWHNWRKAIKQLRYQREFLAEIEGRPLNDFELKVRDLGSLLGQRNDLANLENYVVESEKGRTTDQREALDSAIDESTERVMKKCRKLGKQLFPKKKKKNKVTA